MHDAKDFDTDSLSFKHKITGRAGYPMVKPVGLFMTGRFTGVVSCSLTLYYKPWLSKTHKIGEKGESLKNIFLKFMLESVENLTKLK